MAKNKKTEAPADDTLVFDAMPGADAKTEEDVKPFEVDMNFEAPDEDEVEFPKEEEIEEVEELKAEEESPEVPEEGSEEEGVEAADADAEDSGEETVLAEDGGDTQQPERTVPQGVDEPKEPMIPKSRFDEVLAKQRALQKKLEEATNPVETIEKAPEYEFEAKEVEYQQYVLNGDTEKAAALRAEIRNAERQQMMFEVQNKMGQSVQQSTELVALQNKAAELATKYSVLDETHAEFNKEITQEVLDLRDAFVVQGYTGADALDKAAKYVMAPYDKPASPKVDPVQTKVAQQKQVANTNKKLEAAESQPPSMKPGTQKVEKKVDISLLSSDEFEALPDETLRRMRGDFG
jgi:hypothetical protein